MSLRHFSAVSTLKGKLVCLLRKCLFSVTRASAPTHSVYAAIRASASLRPIASYLAPISKGTKKSSSTIVKALIKAMNSRTCAGWILRFTSAIIVRGIRTTCDALVSSSFSTNIKDASAFVGPKANIYSLESMTSRKLFFPELFPCLAKLFENLSLAHFENRGRISRNRLSELFKMLHGAFGVGLFSFHRLSPLFKFTIKSGYCQIPLLLLLLMLVVASHVFNLLCNQFLKVPIFPGLFEKFRSEIWVINFPLPLREIIALLRSEAVVLHA